MAGPDICPYCTKRPTGGGQDVYSDDHIFSESIGGKKTIRACKKCNDTFGHTFEARNFNQTIIPLRMMLGRAGLQVEPRDTKWKKALKTPAGNVYHLTITSDGLQTETTKPIVKRDAKDPSIFEVTVNQDPGGERLLKQFQDPTKFFHQATTPGEPAREVASQFNLELNKDWQD
ncbi:MAG TPA: HNH endonuclease [Terriglobales bacterium]|nr:HNH endonuclease [Terriglobales bacterium]